MEDTADVEQVRHVEGQSGFPPDELACLGMHRRVDPDMRRILEELGAKGALPDDGKPQGVAVEGDGAVDVGDEDGNAMER